VLFSTRRSLWVILDFLVVVALYELGIRLSPYGGYRDIVSPYVALSVVFGVAFVAISLGLGSYDRDKRFDLVLLLRNALIAAILATFANLAFHYFTLYDVVGRLTLVFGGSFALVGSVGFRAAVARSVRSHPYRFTVIGEPSGLGEVFDYWNGRGDQKNLHLHVPWETIFADPDSPTDDELIAADVAEIVFADRLLPDQQAIDFALMSLRANVPVVDERTFYAQMLERVPLDRVSKRWVLEQGLTRPQGIVVAAKRATDILAASLGIIILTPILLLISLAVRLSSPGPVLFVQTRQGRFFEPFRMLKFRTMWNENQVLDAPFTSLQDARVTRAGRFLRRFHLDELPQLFNILRGDMSLVGPRPETVEFARRMDGELPLYELRYVVRPGLTGHAQLRRGYAMDTVSDTREKLAYDLFYLCNYSMRLDLQILLRTVFYLVRGSR
jgi:lipopolysaccharide/colanic/teichoic acid biosynthesis glycosyltransferase